MAEPGEKQEEIKAEGAAEDTAAKPKKDLLTFIILGLVVVNLGLLGGLGFMLKKMVGQIHELQERPAVVAQLEEGDGSTGLGKELQPKELGTLFPLDGFLVNLTGGEGPKFLQVQMELELSNPDAELELTRKKAAIRDAIIVLLSSKSYKELKDPTGIRKLRKDLIKSIGNELSTGSIRDIYFTQFHFN